MATNNLTPEQDLLTREFFQKVSNDPALFPSDPVGQRNMNQCILRILNYVYIEGAYITPGKVIKRSFSETAHAECEWEADTNRAMEAIDEANNSKSTNQADSSESATDTEVREAVLREDV